MRVRVRKINREIKKIGWICCLLVLYGAAVTASAQSGDLHQTYDLAPGGVVSVTNLSGYIRVTSWDENRVRVDGVRRGRRGVDLDQVRIEVSAQPGAIHIKSVYPGVWPDGGTTGRAGERGDDRRRREANVSVDFDLKVPRSAVLNSLTSISGEIVVIGPVAQVTARSTSGEVTARDVRGPATLTSVSGGVSAVRIGGVLVANSMSGEVSIEAAEASVNAQTASGGLRGVGLRGDAAFNSASGEIRIERAAGRASARSASGSVTVIEAASTVYAESLASDVTIENARGRVTANTLNGGIIIRGAQDGVRATAVNGDIRISNVRGRIDAGTTSGDITLQQPESREIQAKTTSGSVSFQGRLQADGRYHFESFSGEIIVILPAESTFNLTARTYNGSINTEFPIQLAPGSSLGGGRNLRGTAGAGGAELITTGYSGSILLKKATAGNRRER